MKLLLPDIAGVLLVLERHLAGRTTYSNRALDDMLAADFREFGRSGKVWARPGTIAAMAEENGRAEPEIQDFQVQNLSDCLALVTYVSVRHRPGHATEKNQPLIALAAGSRPAMAHGFSSGHTDDMTIPRHTPYDGSTKPFTIGLGALDPQDWIEPEADPAPYLEEKDRLWQQARDLVFAEAADTRASQSELLALLADHLVRNHGGQYHREGSHLHFGNRNIDLADPDLPPLKIAGSLVADDLLILRRKPEGWTLVAATLSFPSSWSLADKFGRTMDMIHAPVPGFECGTRNAVLINRMFDNLHTPVWRRNWSLNPTDDLYLSRPKEGHNLVLQEPLAPERIFIRVERQSLRKLPQSGDIVFSIRIHIDPLSALLLHPRASACLTAFADQLENLEPAQRSYKGLAHNHHALVSCLRKASLQQ